MMCGRGLRTAQDRYPSGWRVIGKSICGASHLRRGLPNQDAIRWLPESGIGLPSILAVSDGHGSARCFRSQIGASLAVKTATEVVREFLNGQPSLTQLSIIKRTAEERLPQALVRRWREAVAEDIRKNPFSRDELNLLESETGPATRQTLEANRLLAYGATLLTTLVTESFILYLQLGDGDILTVSKVGAVTRPLPEDRRLFANETTSLCSDKAWNEFRIGFQVLFGPPPALILLSTDGYANSFRDEEGFLKVGPDLLKILRLDGPDKVKESLEMWLTEASQAGSGDDVTLGILCRMEALNKSPGYGSAAPALRSGGIEVDDGRNRRNCRPDDLWRNRRRSRLGRRSRELTPQRGYRYGPARSFQVRLLHSLRRECRWPMGCRPGLRCKGGFGREGRR